MVFIVNMLLCGIYRVHVTMWYLSCACYYVVFIVCMLLPVIDEQTDCE